MDTARSNLAARLAFITCHGAGLAVWWTQTGLELFQQRRSAMKVKEVMHKGVDWVGPDTLGLTLQS